MAMANAGDFLARAFFPKPLVDQAIAIEYQENGKPVVYKQRWLILVAYCLGYFSWNFIAYRTLPLISEFALYYDQPNEIQGLPNVGIDFLLIFESFLLLGLYPIGGMLVDKYGLQMMVYGALGQAISAWWWFLAFENYTSVIISKFLSNLAGACIASCLLRISNNWFADDERPLAVALGALFGSFGGGAALIVCPFFVVGDDLVDENLISCRLEDLVENNITFGQGCVEEAEEAFCCAADTNIDGLNFFMAIWGTAVAVYTYFVTYDAPKTPPSKSGVVRKGPTFKKAMKIMFSHWNYVQICITDFVSSGPPLVLFSTVDRIFPPSVSDLSTFSASGAFVLAIPIGAYFSKRLAETQKFYELTRAGYISGCVAWLIATILIFLDSEVADYMVIVVGSIAIICYVMWTVSVYELKMEYVFSPDYAIQGYVVAVDRTVINLSASVFLAAIPPERYKGDTMTGRQFTFVIGSLFMIIGAILASTIPNSRDYRRKAYEEENNVTVAEILNSNTEYDKEVIKSHVEATEVEVRQTL